MVQHAAVGCEAALQDFKTGKLFLFLVYFQRVLRLFGLLRGSIAGVVCFFKCRAEVVVHHVGVFRRGRDPRMPKQLLSDQKIFCLPKNARWRRCGVSRALAVRPADAAAARLNS